MSDRLLPHDAALERLKALHPKLIDLSLGRMQAVAAALGNPQDKLPPVIHVAGTNGKGSTLAFLRAIFEAAGLKVHAYTSPHLVQFRERIRLAGELITDAHLADVLERVEAANAGAPITFFEVTTAAAFVAFADVPADVVLLETGLGGRLDATNILQKPALCVITPIDIDHKDFLGDTLELIAAEKAGIIKPNCPVIMGRQRPEALAILKAKADSLSSPSIVHGSDFSAEFTLEGTKVRLKDQDLSLPRPSLFGAHQAENLALALATAHAFLGERLTPDIMAKGLTTALWPARCQRLTAGPLSQLATRSGSELWLDGGHNPHAAQALAKSFATIHDTRPLRLVTAMLGNKDSAGFFDALKALPIDQVYVTGFASPNAAAPEDLKAAAEQAGLNAVIAADFEAAVDLATQTPARVLICGSLYLAGEVLALSPDTWPR